MAVARRSGPNQITRRESPEAKIKALKKPGCCLNKNGMPVMRSQAEAEAQKGGS